MKIVLVLFAHPRTDRSECNVPLAEAARSVDGVTFVDLYAEVKMIECREFQEIVTPWEREVLMFNV